MKLLKEDFNDILKNQRIKPVFQPIVSLDNGEIIGYEALSRITKPKEISQPEELFFLAGFYGKIWDLEQLCRSKILESYHLLHSEKREEKLFLNVDPMVIHDSQFRTGFTSQFLKQYKLKSDNIIFEVTERSAVDDMRAFKDTINHYKSQGYQIAIDDAGSCYSGLNLICDIVPHYLKLDIALIHNIHKDAIKYAMVKAMVEFANLTNIQLIAEGIEQEEELKTLLTLGVHNGQGYFLRKPNEEFKGIEKHALEIIHKYISRKNTNPNLYTSDKREFHVILFKIENYKSYRAYCEKYGDKNGDALIEMMKDVITKNLSPSETIAMLDADTVVTVLAKKDHKLKCAIIENMFKYKSKEYYTKDDWNQGYISTTNKHGEKKKYPLIEVRSERIV